MNPTVQTTKSPNRRISRRDVLRTSAAIAGGAGFAPWCNILAGQIAAPARPKVAAVFTEFTYRSHAHVILENFLKPYLFNGEPTDPGVEVVSFYADQHPSGDMSRAVSKEYGIPLFDTIGDALRVGGDELAVDAVLSIGEHGNYPVNKLGQREYPRKRFFDEIVAAMRQSRRYVPMFNDKHLSYRWDWAKEMYDTSQELGIPMLAGSSVPLAQRRPPLELPADAEIAEAVSIHGGGLESYDFHGLEVLQSMVEARRGGESGVASVEFLDADALTTEANNGASWVDLARAALAAELGEDAEEFQQLAGDSIAATHAIRIHYVKGPKAIMLKVGNSAVRWDFACRLKDDPVIQATSFYVGPWNNRNLFKALSHAIQTHFRNRTAPYPVERTLLTTGILEAAMRARVTPEQKLATPHLQFAYAPKDYRAMREMGASWKIITDDTPEPQGIDPGPLE